MSTVTIEPSTKLTGDDLDNQFAPFAKKMRDEELPQLMIDTFKHYYAQLTEGETGFIACDEALPVEDLPHADDLDKYEAAGREALSKAVVLKLNGGLGTSMGMRGPKSLLPVKDGLTFLDIIVRQVQHLRQSTGARLPLVLMNSFNTRSETEAALAEYSDFAQDVPVGFVQHKEPKVEQSTMGPVAWPDDPDLEWCPPGHGDIYAALQTSGLLDQLLAAGYEYVFVSNSDNLGATMDTAILGYFAQENLPFVMEVAKRTQADSKGGHLAQTPDGQLILREVAQCPPHEIDQFQDVATYRFFNTNNLWLNLHSLRQVLDERGGILGLPLIRNEKTVDPTDKSSPQVYQLETAMGSAIGVFEGAQAVVVPRSRFVPVKKNNDLLLLRSDVYEVGDDATLHVNPAREESTLPLIDLDERYYKLIDDLRLRFPNGAPSLLHCRSFTVDGDVRFGEGVGVVGAVVVRNEDGEPLWVEDGKQLMGK